MSDARRSTGAAGEALAVTFLRKQGYTLLAQNWRCRHGELDAVMQDGGELVFVEVRTRRGTALGSAAELVTPAKQRRLARLAAAYLAALDEHSQAWAGPWRIDVVAVQLDARGHSTIEHLPSAVGE